jgi:anti-anti-sigma factor
LSTEALADGRWLFVIEGELDLASADRLRDALSNPINDGASGIVIDLAGCSFIDSSGLAVLVEAQRALDGTGAGPGVAIVSPAAQPRRLLKLTSLESFVPVFESREMAEVAIRGRDAPA